LSIEGVKSGLAMDTTSDFILDIEYDKETGSVDRFIAPGAAVDGINSYLVMI